MKSKKSLDSFIKYCKANKTQRFWQALRNWSKYEFIYGSNKNVYVEEIDVGNDFEDTFYKED